MRVVSLLHAAAALTAALAVQGCADVQSSLAPRGAEAAHVALLFWIMTLGSTAIMLGVGLAAAVAMYGPEPWRRMLRREQLVIGGGIVFPVVVLTALLGAAVTITGAESSSRAGQASMRIAISGEQWWWRVTYEAPDGRRVESANEIRIPVGRRVALELRTADVIHSLWIPSLAGKLDMIPGRTTVLSVIATEAGISRGQCAEYCGGAHAFMSLYAVAMEPAEFTAWLEREASPAQEAAEEDTAAGHKLFLTTGCGACHTIRGTRAAGTIGPDLTHLGGRMSLAAATLPNNAETIARWIRDNQHLKPDNRMPPYGVFSNEELGSLARYLADLK
jgi:cytochrome c oxidase subunit 2